MHREIEMIIDKICRSVTNNGDLKDDLKQEVYLILLKKGDIEQRFQDGTLYTFAFGIAYRLYNFPKADFYKKHRRYRFIESSELEEARNRSVEQDQTESEIEEIISGLPEMDRLWVREWLKRGCSLKKLSDDTNISRPSVTARIKQIISEIRCTNLN